MRTGLLILPLAALVGAAGCDSGDPVGSGTTTRLVQYKSCAHLERDLEDMLISELRTRLDQSQHGGWWGGVEDGAADPSSDGGRTEGEDFSGTNNQETGVDEADFVKTDGYHVYLLNGNRLHIFGVPEFGELVPESVTEVEGHPRQMLIGKDTDRVALFSQIHPDQLPEAHPLRERLGRFEDDQWVWRVWNVSKVTILDVSDRTAPALERELYLEGYYQTGRLVDDSVRIGAYSWLNVPTLWGWDWVYDDDGLDYGASLMQGAARIRAMELADLIPFIYERQPDGTVTTHSLSRSSCASFRRPTDSHAYGITSILSFDLGADEFAYDADHVVSNWPTLYASTDTLVVAEPANGWWWSWWNDDTPERLNIHSFDISVPGKTLYRGSGRVDGLLHDQFSLDEHDDYIRVATTSNMWARWWVEDPPEAENHVYVLDLQGDELVTVGHVDGIAPGERIFSARLQGDRGYLVTFQQIDPLFTLDLSNPHHPQVIGELEIPGFSTYIHPIADDKLLTIGVGGDENGANWRTQISMFDVADFASPSLFDVEALVGDDGWGWSEAMYEHKAFQYWAPKKLLAVPLSSYRNLESPNEWGGYWEYTSRLELVTVDLEGGLSPYGSIDHSDLYNVDSDQYWYYRDIRRSIFMGDYIYAISDRGVSVHRTSDLGLVTLEPLPGYSPNDWYWWW